MRIVKNPPEPFHEGELAVQRRAGVAAMAAKVGAGIHDVLPPPAAAFLAARRFAVVGATDEGGRVWASPVVGEEGFLHVPEERTLEVRAAPPATDPLYAALRGEARVGLIAIDFAARRRVRVNGTAVPLAGDGFAIHVEQAYANCPKYIRRREPADGDRPRPVAREASRASELSSSQMRWIASADTFFIATAHRERGADASHRGGDPGFVRALDATRLAWPDYVGNAMFQTLGNLATNPACGLVFLDFRTGGALQLSGTARVAWDDPAAREIAGAERLVEFAVEQVIETEGAVHGGWQEGEPSPHNPR
ncbi:MAG TPA: pyridoxamine 5'-phosphate oxidase family protein [Candidatus Binatia bacterium]|nr:pyridoxamine 5'-phosphate oxidase family protein [Candidatus Binatia bacterium]